MQVCNNEVLIYFWKVTTSLTAFSPFFWECRHSCQQFHENLLYTYFAYIKHVWVLHMQKSNAILFSTLFCVFAFFSVLLEDAAANRSNRLRMFPLEPVWWSFFFVLTWSCTQYKTKIVITDLETADTLHYAGPVSTEVSGDILWRYAESDLFIILICIF